MKPTRRHGSVRWPEVLVFALLVAGWTYLMECAR